MINEIKVINNKLTWFCGIIQHEKEIDGGTFINDEHSILWMDNAGRKVLAFDEKGKECGEISNSDELFLMYLQKHPRFGLTVVASVRSEEGDWKDSYMAFHSGKFEIVSNAR